MRMVKSLLLGSAAGLVAVAGAQAADLPVKAKPVEYVKVCSLYGAGFWYVPGTDTCLKIGSFVRTQTSWNTSGSDIPQGAADGSLDGKEDRIDTSDFGFRVRSGVSVDLRTQTEYGTLRSYMDVGAQWSSAGTSVAGVNGTSADTLWVDRGFIQFAGFTAGRIRSYFDINSFAPYGYSNVRMSGDTGALGIYGIAYTAQLGNGITASLSIEDNGQASGGRGHSVVNLNVFGNVTAFTGATGGLLSPGSVGPFTLAGTTTDNEGQSMPDVVGALRIDQAWGYAQVSAALHDSSGGYYTSATGGLTGSQVNGHPSDKIGFAVSGGFALNDILGFKGDTFQMQVAYAEGATGYVTRAQGVWMMYGSGNNAGLGWTSDATFVNGGSIELTTAWGINGYAQHLWSPKWRTSLYGGYVEIDYNANAKANIAGAGTVGGACVPVGFSASAATVNNNGAFTTAGVTNCNPDFSWWQVGSRTQWNPHPDLDIGVDVLWTHLNTAFKGFGTLTSNTNSGRPTGLYTIDDQDVVSVMFRIQRNFLP